ncbi:putative zinc metalloprotease [Lineolata rhizophorae]|uniref:Peptide hydrolase n=1 Tax=Lineolata rhizophorae TaxID=578093 RepID=A0A6A6NW78_9PEZI|nr:putative zinc metalloprotease [Lineolata rhizophorae]
MAKPFGFSPIPVTVFSVIVYVALLAALITLHVVGPQAPSSSELPDGISLDEAWHDLQILSKDHHPYNSKANVEIRSWLLKRLEEIAARNGLSVNYGRSGFIAQRSPSSKPAFNVISDLTSNVTFSSSSAKQSVYFEGTNIIVYVPGSDDPPIDQNWQIGTDRQDQFGVLINAHYDSVSTGFGATDDGVGVVSILQLVSHFSMEGKQPKRGIVALLNNGEEDYLNGAHAFMRHPISRFPHAFVNLEGAGAGGRATLFRTTDTEVSRYYAASPYPFGTVVSSDGFAAGFIRSQTDYVVFNGELGLRGLDIAFMEPRSRYHTMHDSTRYTSRDSVWHMLSAALATMEGLSSSTDGSFTGEPRNDGKVNAGSGSTGVWFDLFGRVFLVFQLRSLFAVSVTLLVVAPLIILATFAGLKRADKLYVFKTFMVTERGQEKKTEYISGWDGFVRFPIALILACAVTIALGILIGKINPYIVYSSQWAVWSTLLSGFFCMAWVILAGTYLKSPSALQRFHSLLWMFVMVWILLVLATVTQNNFHLGSSYFIVALFLTIALAFWISCLELFALDTVTLYKDSVIFQTLDLPPGDDDERGRVQQTSNERGSEENAPLLGDSSPTFARYGSVRSQSPPEPAAIQHIIPEHELAPAYGHEQKWSWKMPQWTWILQIILLAPVTIVLVGQLGLILTSAVHQTPADGSPALLVYGLMMFFAILLLFPLLPFIHMIKFRVPHFLILVLIGTVIYNCVAFPFSINSQLKVYFLQQVDLESGLNNASLIGLMPFVHDILADYPSAQNQSISCETPSFASRSGLAQCFWAAPAPSVGSKSFPPSIPPEKDYGKWVTFNVTRDADAKRSATFNIDARNTRSCRILFQEPVSSINVTGGASDPRFEPVGEHGTTELRLWRRDWKRPWEVKVGWESGPGLDGHVVCLWNEEFEGQIPALEEVRKFSPAWATVSKASDGLVEGRKAFMV